MGRKHKQAAIASDAARTFAASIFVVPERAPAKAREPWKVPCLFGNADCGTFDPKGVGAAWHTTCADGREVARACKAAEAAGEPRETIRQRVLDLIAEHKAS